MDSGDSGLLRALQQRHGDVVGWRASDFVYTFGSPQAALLYSALFVPEFIEIEDIVVLKDHLHDGPEKFIETVRDLRGKSLDKLKTYVDSFNWIELTYLFSTRSATESEISILAELVVEAWRARLGYLYPKRRFLVRILPPEETGDALGLGVEQEF